MRQFSPTELREYLSSGNNQPQLVDVRETWEYEICHIANSELIPMANLFADPDQLDKNSEIVLICHHGIRSYHAGLFLRSQGFQELINLSGGVERWAQEVEPGMPRY
ncbi:MAG: rhodanese-like domain-containing protein [Gammaproteobacteria bacterium]|nr:rhodanese-like domain-containing protein [Gammaproteobacteria bacterium]